MISLRGTLPNQSDLTNGSLWSHQDIQILGLSLSGIRTAISIPDLSCAFDVAQGFPFLINLKNFFISHGHLDHAAGIPYIISQKAMHHHEPPVFYMPTSLVEPMTRILKTWEEIEGHFYDLKFIGVTPDQEIPLKGEYFVKAFPTTHRIDSLGYTVFRRRKKLRHEFRKLSEHQLQKLKSENVEIQEFQDTALISFSGDTTLDFIKMRPWISESKVLLLECTYLDEKKSVEHARKWGHTHLDEIIPLLGSLQNEKIVLIHLSSRYSTRVAKEIISARIPKEYQNRVEIFPGR